MADTTIALDFDGKGKVNNELGDHLELGNLDFLSSATTGFTFECWLRFNELEDNPNGMAIFNIIDEDHHRVEEEIFSEQHLFGIWINNDNRIQVKIRGEYAEENNRISSKQCTIFAGKADGNVTNLNDINPAVTDKTWHHLAVVATPTTNTDSTLVVYLDGEKLKFYSEADQGLTSFKTLGRMNESCYIGFNADGSTRTFHGQMKEIRLWKVPRSAEEIVNNKNSTFSLPTAQGEDNLYAYYNFQGQEITPEQDNKFIANEGIKDNSKNDHVITTKQFKLSGPSSNFVNGEHLEIDNNWGTYLHFDGENKFGSSKAYDHLKLDDFGLFQRNTQLKGVTIECWLNREAPRYDRPDGMTIFNALYKNLNRFLLFISINHDDRIQVSFLKNYIITTPYKKEDFSKWVHLAVVVKEKEAPDERAEDLLKIYLNGERAKIDFKSIKPNFKLGTNSAELDYLIGYYMKSSPRSFSGKMKEIRIWNAARTEAEIKANKQSLVANTNTDNLYAHYNFEGQGIIPGGDNTKFKWQRNRNLEKVEDKSGNNRGATLKYFELKDGKGSNFGTDN